LSTIARAHNVTVAALAQANGIGNTGLIVPGQQLFIPTGNQDGLGAMPLGSDGYHVHTKFPTATEKWIDVDLSEQRLVAYRGHRPIRSFIISSGLPATPTVTGTFRIWAKTPMQDMYAGNRATGYSYYLEDVQWVQYFYKDYGIHGAYWHNNFGQPMSRGCINMRNEDAKWLFEWASPTVAASHGWFISDEENEGTLVVVHD
jgi:lipoprotein-anchoring transpeptidase ErfK/SrfK